MSHKSEEAACVRRQGVQKLLPQTSRAFVVPHALGLLTAADEGKLASAAVLVLELIDKKSLYFTRYSAGGAARGLRRFTRLYSERTSKKEHVVLHDRQQVQKNSHGLQVC